MRVFVASFGGRCTECDGRIVAGDVIGYNDDGWLIHESCEECAHPQRLAHICPDCHLAKPCECDEP